MNDQLNPYLNTEGQGELRNSVVAFLDVLGFKELVRDAKNNGNSQQLFAEFQAALNEVSFSLKDSSAEDWYILSKGELKIKATHNFRVFTDCILIGCPIEDSFHHGALIKGLDAFYTVFNTLYFIQSQLTNRGFFTRGAITVDELYVDEKTIYGLGLIDAYEAESKLAKYPRIILTESAKTKFMEIDKTFEDLKHTNYLKKYLYKDSDGLLFINYLESINITDHPFLDVLEKHKKVIEDKLQKHYGMPDILEKYVWAAKYHNLFCNLDSKDEYKIDLVRYQMQST